MVNVKMLTLITTSIENPITHCTFLCIDRSRGRGRSSAGESSRCLCVVAQGGAPTLRGYVDVILIWVTYNAKRDNLQCGSASKCLFQQSSSPIYKQRIRGLIVEPSSVYCCGVCTKLTRRIPGESSVRKCCGVCTPVEFDVAVIAWQNGLSYS